MAENNEPDFEALAKELDLSPMDQDAIQMFELYKSLTKAGFNERQALYLVAMIVNEAGNDGEIVFTSSDDDDDEDDDDES